MDRRTTLATLLGRPTTSRPVVTLLRPVSTQSGLAPYTGEWTDREARHLLRRTTFGPTKPMITSATQQGLAATIAQLFSQPLPLPPVNHNNEQDPYVPIGETWVTAPYSPTVNLRTYRNQSLRAWTYNLLLEEGLSIREKLTLFWHNHFAVSDINDPRFLYQHITLIREHAWGNFRELIKQMVIDPTMLRFLNGNQNTKNAPNENFARELLELFTIGKGPQVAPGDYTNYTEEDVLAMAKVLTGWRDTGFNSVNPEAQIGSLFRANQHDTSTKQLSPRFGNATIEDLGDQEYAQLVDIIFQQDEVARFISRKLYRWFVYYEISETTEQQVIEPMAQLVLDADYDLRPALEALLQSEHFFDQLSRGPMIKHPIDFVVSAVKPLGMTLPTDLATKYVLALRLFQQSQGMEMAYFDPPNVAGWKAYYQEPQFYRTWISASTLQRRKDYTDRMTNNGFYINGERYTNNMLDFVATLDDPYDPNKLIDETVALLLPHPLNADQLGKLKEVLIPGLPDYEWTTEYADYIADPDNAMLRRAVEQRLRDLLRAIMGAAEFHLS